MRVLLQIRPNATKNRGGDTRVFEQITAGLRAAGLVVEADDQGTVNPAGFDVVHLFNFATPDYTRMLGQRAKDAGVPFVVTALHEDTPNFYNQAVVQARTLIEYVRRGQDRGWLAAEMANASSVERSPSHDNRWIVQNAAMLFSSGAAESASIRKVYGAGAPIVEIPFGCEVGSNASRDVFLQTHGLTDFVLCVGRLELRKNQLALLTALEDSDLPVVLITSGVHYQPEYTAAVKAFKRRGKTLILEHASAEMLASAYASARVHALPSWYELPGLVSLEAAKLGCNVVSTTLGTGRDCLGDRAFYCRPDDIDAIRSAVMAGYYSPVAPELADIASTFTWERTVRETIRAYNSIAPAARTSAVPAPVAKSQDIDDLIRRAETAAHAREYNTAHELFGQVIEADPSNVRALRARGAVFLAENNIARGEEYLRKAHSFAKDDPRVLSGLAMCEMSDGRLDAAYEHVVHSLRFDPERLVTIMQLVELSYKLSRFADLEATLRRFLASRPNEIEMRYCLAGCVYKQGRIAESRAIAEEVLAQNAEHLGAKQLMEMIAKETPVPAAVQPEPPRPVAPTISEVWEQEIQQLEELKRQKKFADSIEGCRAVIERHDTPSVVRDRVACLRAENWVLQGHVIDAEVEFERIRERSPDCARAIAGQGAVAALSGDWSDAQKKFSEALAIDPGHDVANAGLGMCLMFEKDYATAKAHYLKALARNQENGSALLGMIQVGYATGDFEDLEVALNNYLDMHPGDINFIYSYAGCLYAQGRHGEALGELNKVLALSPGHPHAMELRQRITSGTAWGSAWEAEPMTNAR